MKKHRRETGSECDKGREWRYIPKTLVSFWQKQSFPIVANFIEIRYECTIVNKVQTYIYHLTPRNTVSPKYGYISHLFRACSIPCTSHLPKCYGRNNFSWSTSRQDLYFSIFLLETHRGLWYNNLKERDHKGAPGIDGRTILKCILKTRTKWCKLGSFGSGEEKWQVLVNTVLNILVL